MRFQPTFHQTHLKVHVWNSIYTIKIKIERKKKDFLKNEKKKERKVNRKNDSFIPIIQV